MTDGVKYIVQIQYHDDWVDLGQPTTRSKAHGLKEILSAAHQDETYRVWNRFTKRESVNDG